MEKTVHTDGFFSFPPPVARFLPLVYLLHFVEEWFGGLTAWTLETLGNDIPTDRLLLINGVAFILFLAGTIASFLIPRMAWFCTAFAALLGLNGVLHTLATLAYGQYAPGVITGVLAYIPISIVILRASSKQLPRPLYIRSIWVGIIFHGLVSFLAFL